MKAGYTKEIINPYYPCKMEGYNEARFCFNQTPEQKAASGQGLRTALGQRDDLLMDVLCLEAQQKVVFFQLDICIVESEFVEYCRKSLMKEFGLLKHQISISCSHTHNSPVVSHGMAYDLKPDLKYWDLIRRKMIFALHEVFDNMEEATIYYDQHVIQGYFNNRNRPMDYYNNHCDELIVLGKNDRPIVKVLNFACHPTILGAQNHLVTADFFGIMRKTMQGYDGLPVMIWNGEAGDVSPRLLKKGVDWNECIRYGEGIAAQLMYESHPNKLEVSQIDIAEVIYEIDYSPKQNAFLHDQKEKLEKELLELEVGSDRYNRITTCYLYDVNEKLSKDHVYYKTLSYVYDFGAFRVVFVPCEIDTVLGSKIRNADDKLTFLCSYGNGFHYYAVNKDEYGIVFESYNTYFPYGAADEMVDKIIQSFKK